ncbi:MAG: DsrE family protein [Gammaproteobacteria bacterium]|jgi:intracellular sulfur oxidation DsrE/DsrF family protein|nr:DsrE family protein [Gammaproteobacteria bacterium]MBT3726067.1 DsrE family protein [Gammaproteobacteria bacterium]MBT4077674.1 DsrE family protein [Gammaproteobacteria bacterium]MBT4195238.1 DsrE family protein [Gammaproteobacteria bacterium]MBT4451702.1 DsrE family protein [Gammaproteobacteria bacterium]
MFTRIINIPRFVLVIFLLILQSPSFATEFSNLSVNKIIQSNVVPNGVVFELMSWDKNTWQWASPMINSLRNQLKAKFPDIDVAVVSHGAEQFQLTKDKVLEQTKAIAQLSELVEDGVSLHVCGTHSSWRDIPDSAYIDIADVAPSGPAQINNYINIGYKHVLLQRPL